MVSIFCIDEDAATARMLELAKPMGSMVVPVRSEAEWYRLEKVGRDDLVMVDPFLCRRTGFFQLTRVLEAARGAPVIVCSEESSEPEVVRCMAMGASGFLRKPLSPVELRSTLDGLAPVSVRRYADELELALGPSGRCAFEAACQLFRHPGDGVTIAAEDGCLSYAVAKALHDKVFTGDGRNWDPRLRQRFLPYDAANRPFETHFSDLVGAPGNRGGLAAKADGGTLVIEHFGSLEPGTRRELMKLADDARAGRGPGLRLVAVGIPSSDDGGSWPGMGTVVSLAPVRQRLDELAAMVWHFVGRYREFCPGCPVSRVSADTLKLLSGHSWKGNLEELRHRVHRACRLERSALLGPGSFLPLD